ncbi:epoxide hydrolase family protein [Pararoseomonas sp. SCSIO 73927]|uniref:epoxide hydrolase family protein n=1 Tax=Pararoseomonas sp. SCSIO 73927 TaxID=3114537 RepID=UPI0030D1A8F9
METRPFEVRWDPAALAHLKDRLRATPLPRQPRDAGWKYGCDPDFLSALRDHWLEGYDADAAAAALNRHPQITARVEDLDIHAYHVVGEAGGKRPLLLTHGWPGSVLEFLEVIEPLAFPSRHGGRAEDAFDLVIPSLPGFGFSGKPEAPISARTTARLFDVLMRGLGYPRYRAQGGDWGAAVTAWLALDHVASLKAIHLNMVLVRPDTAPKTPEELAWQAEQAGVQGKLGAYAQLQGTKPQSLAYAMQDNPLAQAAWIVERFHDWADLRERPFEQVFTKDQLITDVMIYAMNDAFTTGAWYYFGAMEEGVRNMPPGRRVMVPTAVASYPDPRSPMPPRSFVEKGYAVNRWSDMPRGGHFPALEVPDDFVADLRAWGRQTEA